MAAVSRDRAPCKATCFWSSVCAPFTAAMCASAKGLRTQSRPPVSQVVLDALGGISAQVLEIHMVVQSWGAQSAWTGN